MTARVTCLAWQPQVIREKRSAAVWWISIPLPIRQLAVKHSYELIPSLDFLLFSDFAAEVFIQPLFSPSTLCSYFFRGTSDWIRRVEDLSESHFDHKMCLVFDPFSVSVSFTGIVSCPCIVHRLIRSLITNLWWNADYPPHYPFLLSVTRTPLSFQKNLSSWSHLPPSLGHVSQERHSDYLWYISAHHLECNTVAPAMGKTTKQVWPRAERRACKAY